MSQLAAVILAHNDPAKVRRLILSLRGADIFLHCDLKTRAAVAREMSVGFPEVHIVPRRRTKLASWSLVEAELSALRLALERSTADHIVVMSGGCYPMVSTAQLADELEPWRGLSRLELNPLPYGGWSSRRHPDGGMWRFERRFLTIGQQLVTVRGMPLPTFARPLPRGLALRASAQWKIYARRHARAVLDTLDGSKELRSFWQGTYIPDESCVASILQSPDLVGDIVEQVRGDLPWYIRWPESNSFHPVWLTEADFEDVRRAACAPPRPVDWVDGPGPTAIFRKLLARKISSASGRLLTMIDDELRR